MSCLGQDCTELELSAGELTAGVENVQVEERTGGGGVVIEGETHAGAALTHQSGVHSWQTRSQLVLHAALNETLVLPLEQGGHSGHVISVDTIHPRADHPGDLLNIVDPPAYDWQVVATISHQLVSLGHHVVDDALVLSPSIAAHCLPHVGHVVALSLGLGHSIKVLIGSNMNSSSSSTPSS